MAKGSKADVNKTIAEAREVATNGIKNARRNQQTAKGAGSTGK